MFLSGNIDERGNPYGATRRRRVAIITVVMLFVSAALYQRVPGQTVSASPATAAPADFVIQQHIEALGGTNELEKVHSAVTSGTMKFAGSETPFDFRLVQSRGKYLLILRSGEMSIHQGFDGEVIWEAGEQGARILEGSERTAAINNNGLVFPEVTWSDGTYDGEIRYVGQQELEQTECHVIDFLPNNGTRVRRYFDSETFLIRRIKSLQGKGANAIVTQVRNLDWRNVDEVRMPFREQFAAAGELVYTLDITGIRLNPEIDDSLFAVPESVREIIGTGRR